MKMPKNVLRVLALFFGSILLLSGCSGKLRLADVTGTYSAALPYGDATLVLNASGTYSQTFKYKSGKIVKNSGKWKYGTAGENSILLENALTVEQNLGPPQYGLYREQVWSLKAESVYGKPFIEFNEGLGFHKIK